MSLLGPTGKAGNIGPSGGSLQYIEIRIFYRESTNEEFPHCLESKIMFATGGGIGMIAPAVALVDATKEILGEDSNNVMIMRDCGKIFFKNKDDAMMVKLAVRETHNGSVFVS